ncbi:MAG: dTDP-glucose 4,6-dehydratase [Spirochaetia bacterium]|nr:dTDP-glucose 4,6-dehydratase [Spirochaetia bacterium]
MKKILVTGGAGFIGGNFIKYMLEQYEDVFICNLDKLTYAGDLRNLESVKEDSRYSFIEGDICDKNLLNRIFTENEIKGVFHFAAESHVDNSIAGPEVFVKTNVLGTFQLLETARNFWMSDPFVVKEQYKNARFLHVSTDEVYGSLGEDGFFTEETSYAPNSPYSASKAGSDMLVRSYYHTYGLNTVITNCSNNYGPCQHDEKLIPVIIRKAISKEKIPIYGDGKNIRDWLFVKDHCKALDIAFQKGRAGEVYNIGGSCEKNNIQIANLICEILDDINRLEKGGSYKQFISFVKDRPGHDRRYAIDSSKMMNELDWRAETKFEDGLKETVRWYIEKYKELL